MSGTVGTITLLIVVAIGLTGLGVALAQMMTHSDPNSVLLSLGGLGVYLAASIFALIAVR
jgi:hypothetical protein